MEHLELVKYLLQQNEGLCLEFKSYWYWEEEKKKDKGLDEFLKDFISMFNTYDEGNIRYIIFGFDEKTKKKNDYFKTSKNEDLDDIKNI